MIENGYFQAKKQKTKAKRRRAFRPTALKDCLTEIQIQLRPTSLDSYTFAFLKLTGAAQTEAKVMTVDSLPSISLSSKASKHISG